MEEKPPINLLALDAAELQHLLSNRELTSVDLLRQILAQIELEDRAGLRLQAMISVAPEPLLLATAAELDAERSRNKIRGPLHGIPIIIKASFSNLLGA